MNNRLIIPQRGSKIMVLPMIVYTSGEIHVGHVRSYTICDVMARWLRFLGYQVMFKFGFDAFGLPTEMKAQQEKINPVKWTDYCAAQMTNELKQLRMSFDWSNIINTSKPDYYLDQQQIFVDLYKNGWIYRSQAEVFWDPVMKTTLAREQVDENGICDRTRSKAEVKILYQWFFRTSGVAKDLHDDLSQMAGWPERIKLAQDRWIGYQPIKNIQYKGLSIEVVPQMGRINCAFVNDNNGDWSFLSSLDIMMRKTNGRNILGYDKNIGNYGLTVNDLMVRMNQLGASMDELDQKFKIRDWCISRQRYFGCPIPAAYCHQCGWVIDSKLITKSIVTDTFYPMDQADMDDWINIKCPVCGKDAKRDTDTLDVLFDSSWYPIKYCGGVNGKSLDFLPVSVYIGGSEHATGHLIYIRAMFLVLSRIYKAIPSKPVVNFWYNGMVLSHSYRYSDGNYAYADEVTTNKGLFMIDSNNVSQGEIEKMSKSKKNVYRLSKLLKKYNVESIRLCAMADFPLENDMLWSDQRTDTLNKLNDKIGILEYCPVLEKAKNCKDFERVYDLFMWGRFNKIIAWIYKNINKRFDQDTKDLFYAVWGSLTGSHFKE